MNLSIVKGNIPHPAEQTETLVVPFGNLKSWLKDGSFFLRRRFSYQSATLHVYRLDTVSRPLLMALVLRSLSRGAIYFEDVRGKRQQVTFSTMLKFWGQFLKDSWRKLFFLRRLAQEVKQELESIEYDKKKPSLDLSGQAIYLRTDVSFAVSSGGSIGHITGVLSNLHHFTGSPIFFSTDTIPGVESHIDTQIITFPPDFWDFPGLLTLSSGAGIEANVKQYLQVQPYSFIYQRYSLNDFSGVKLAKHYGLPFVLEYNGSEVWIVKNWGYNNLKNEALSLDIERLNFLAADLIVVVSQPLKDELVAQGIEPDKILVNYNGVDPDKYSSAIDGSAVRQKYDLEGKTVIGFIGTFGPWHGAEVLAEAFGKLLTTYPEYQTNARLLLIGDGKKMPEVQQNLARYNVTDYSVLTGLVPQAEGPQHLAACDILASPHVPNPDGTPFFGSPTKLFEYMAMGKGIVASRLDQINEVLSHNETAYMVEPGNVDALMMGLKTLIDDVDLREKLGAAARREAVAKHTWYQHTARIIEKLRERTQ